MQAIGLFPFFEEIKLREPSMKFISPKCPGYKGMKDHITHVFLFKTIMYPLNMPLDKWDAMLYKSLLATLHDFVGKWISDLKLFIINSFAELIKLFITYYANNKSLKKEPRCLFSIV